MALPVEDRNIHTRDELCDELAMLLGGRAAEELVFDDPSTGAANDIERVTQIARSMVTAFGMSARLGPQQYGRKDGEVFLGREFNHEANYSEAVAALIDDEVRRFVDDAHTKAQDLLAAERATLDALAAALIEFETLDEDDLAEIWATHLLAPARSGQAGFPLAAEAPTL